MFSATKVKKKPYFENIFNLSRKKERENGISKPYFKINIQP